MHTINVATDTNLIGSAYVLIMGTCDKKILARNPSSEPINTK